VEAAHICNHVANVNTTILRGFGYGLQLFELY